MQGSSDSHRASTSVRKWERLQSLGTIDLCRPSYFKRPGRIQFRVVIATNDEFMSRQGLPHGLKPTWRHFIIRIAKNTGLPRRGLDPRVLRTSAPLQLRCTYASELR